MRRERLSLKVRALNWLAQREHSRSELRRKLLRVARAELDDLGHDDSGHDDQGHDSRAAHAARAQVGTDPVDSPDLPAWEPGCSDTATSAQACIDPERHVDELLDWLEARRFLCEARFVENRVNARASRYGDLRIRQELSQHGVDLDADTRQRLRETELERARAVWARKFSGPATEPAERARQMRFLAQRGFSADVVRRVVRGADDEGDC